MTKAKPPRHVAVACVFSPGTHRLLMITSRKHPHLWIIPKGGIEEGETSGQSAVREAWEEAGTPQDLVAPPDDQGLMMISMEPGPSQKRGAVWHVHAIEASEERVNQITEWPEKQERHREWVAPRQCLERIQQWYGDSSARVEDEGEPVMQDVEAMGRGSKGKKSEKGGAMEMALRAFVERYGWEKSGIEAG